MKFPLKKARLLRFAIWPEHTTKQQAGKRISAWQFSLYDGGKSLTGSRQRG
jgi:hypothetical protein